MDGHRYFGAHYFGAHYFGPASGSTPIVLPPTQQITVRVWAGIAGSPIAALSIAGNTRIEQPAEDDNTPVAVHLLQFRPFEKLYVNSVVRLFAEFTREDELVDPPGRILMLSRSPSCIERLVTVTRIEEGTYSSDVQMHDEAGRWGYEWRSMASDEQSIIGRMGSDLRVFRSQFYYDPLPRHDYH